ncbi:DNA-binding response regulator, OmpR family, contains REC and winged-helix (wHTH) domain [Clostridium acidisoli DSM 12555]|uniref:Heme response regulator HssR n=1 Tax=Clostridium acidisoli DSM 12555 TaxID=1121291 RepID=A0A1W1XT33_9CLOT|nr:response regulator transcription factor [Clostridium acidisoli]SMC27012.1 DNA-binding response regulator, OmpR family, contains REC and winged-helix (wHTH) domain [Clostridium acidisoli DSM 12555]
MNTVMIVDDDPYICELVSTILKNEGFITFEASDGRDALRKMTDTNPDLCVIDLLMPDMDGFELCRKLRKYYEDMPILMLTAMDDISKKVKGYKLGTDDYLTKPFEPAELIIRVKALFRRYKVPFSEVSSVGKLTVDNSSHTIYMGSERIEDIPLKEFAVLYKLARSQGKIISRNNFIQDIWGYDFEGNERTLDVHINRLRERFPVEQYGFKIIAIRGIGYRLEVTI